ncbi:hypothetical protein D3C86_1752010 [compost metagenome]
MNPQNPGVSQRIAGNALQHRPGNSESKADECAKHDTRQPEIKDDKIIILHRMNPQQRAEHILRGKIKGSVGQADIYSGQR